MTAHPIHAAAAPYLDGTWRYPANDRVARKVAWRWPPGVRGPGLGFTAEEKRIDCTTQTASILMRAYPKAPWDADAYAGLQIARRPFSPDDPITAVVRMGIGVRVDAFVPERWHIVQGVRDLDPFDGHAFIVYSRGNGKLDLLESTSLENGKGPRWRVTTAERLHDGKGGGQFPAALLIAVLVDP